jgi:hypothetical protein
MPQARSRQAKAHAAACLVIPGEAADRQAPHDAAAVDEEVLRRAAMAAAQTAVAAVAETAEASARRADPERPPPAESNWGWGGKRARGESLEETVPVGLALQAAPAGP